MDILIRNMDMPSMCCECPCCEYDMEYNKYYCLALKNEPQIINEDIRLDDCPLETDLNKRDWFNEISSSLRDYSDGEVWSNGDEILCRTESIARGVEDLLFQLYSAQGEMVTICSGYYDPIDDKEHNTEDRHTGWWYVYID